MIDAWWLAPAIAGGLLTGLAIGGFLGLVIRTTRTLPMDGRTYTGDLDEADQFLRDLNQHRDAG